MQPEDASGESEVIVSEGSRQPDARDGLRLELRWQRHDFRNGGGLSRRRWRLPPNDGGQDDTAADDSEYERVQGRQVGGDS